MRDARSSPYAPVPGGWLAQLSSTRDGIELILTDMRQVYVGCMEDALLAQQMEDIEPDEAVKLLHKELEGKNSSGQSIFRIVEDATGDGPIRFHWELSGSTAYNIPCYSALDAARILRDTLLVPLLRASEAAQRLIPASVDWPPQATGGAASLLPDFASDQLRALLDRLAPEPGAPSQGGAAVGSGTGSSSGVGGEAVVAPIPLDGTDAEPPSQAPPQSGLPPHATSLPGAAPVVVVVQQQQQYNKASSSEEEERKRRAHEERERKKQKTAKK